MKPTAKYFTSQEDCLEQLSRSNHHTKDPHSQALEELVGPASLLRTGSLSDLTGAIAVALLNHFVRSDLLNPGTNPSYG